MLSTFRPALVMFVLFSILTGLLYPALVTGIGRLAFAHGAAGSLVSRDGKVVGSILIGQSFSRSKYFWSRPSATAPMPNNAQASSGSNLGPTNPALVEAVKARIDALKAADPDNTRPIPADLVSASASGLDPEISPAAAFYQVARVARIRGLSRQAIEMLVARHIEGPQWMIFGEPRVNVLALNLDLDRLH